MTPWLLFLLPLLGGFVAWASPSDRRWLGGWACTVLAATFVLALLAGTGAPIAINWGGELRLLAELTPLSKLVAQLVPAVALCVVAYAAAHEHARGLQRLIALMLAFVGWMELLVIAGDLLTLLIGWELVGACSWALIGHRWREEAPGASATFAFLITRAGDLGLFVAAMAAFAGAGSFTFGALPELPAPLIAMAAGGVLVSAAAKSGQVPFAPWLFRAMDGPTSVSALLHAATMVAAGAYLLARLQPMLAPVAWFGPAAITIGLMTALSGGVVALLQPHAKKLLAASTSAHYGLMFVAAGAGFPLVAILHMVAHGFFKALLFLTAGIAGERAGDFQLRHMGLGRLLPVTAAASVVGALALAGVPPLGGGWTKEEIVSAARHDGLALAFGVMIAGALSAAYAARFHLLAFGRQGHGGTNYLPSAVEKGSAALLALASIVLGLLWIPGLHVWLTDRFGEALPLSRTSELLVSLVLVALGVAAGAWLARARALGTAGAAALLADWLQLPAAIRATVTEPARRLAGLAATLDDQVVDAPARWLTWLGRIVAMYVAIGDDAVVDHGVRASIRLGGWFSSAASGMGEWLSDTLPKRTARTIAFGGRQAMRLQTGMTHQYYAAIAGGLIVIVALTFLGT